MSKHIAIIGSGPAALMAAEVMSRAGAQVTIYEKRKSLARKLLIAGSSGLNVTNDAPVVELLEHYTGSKSFWRNILGQFSREAWLEFLTNLGMKPFLGTSGRYFVEDMKGAKLLKAWTDKLKAQGVEFILDEECMDFEGRSLKFASGITKEYSAVVFCLGGGSYEELENPLRWPEIFKSKKIKFNEFESSNAGFDIDWPRALLKEADRKPLKGIVLTSSKGSKKGDALITSYGIEGTPVYFVGESGEVNLDLMPDKSEVEILKQLESYTKENLSPIRRVKKVLKLNEAALAILYHLSSQESLRTNQAIAHRIKQIKLELKNPRPLTEAISSKGGVSLDELNESLMLKQFPGIFLAGEMLDWDAPTGGFLIQGCVSQGAVAGMGVLRYLKLKV